MPHTEEAFELLKNFFESKPACRGAMLQLKNKVEIQVALEDGILCALGMNKDVFFEKRPAKGADVQFYISDASIRTITATSGDKIGELGVDVLKEVVGGGIQIKVIGGIFSILTNGYLGIIKAAGPEFMGFLASHGFSNVNKIVAHIKKMRS